MTATIQHHALARYLLTAYCPRCGLVVESQVLVWQPSSPDGHSVQPLAPDVLRLSHGWCYLWMHVPCGGVLVEVASMLVVLAPIA